METMRARKWAAFRARGTGGETEGLAFFFGEFAAMVTDLCFLPVFYGVKARIEEASSI